MSKMVLINSNKRKIIFIFPLLTSTIYFQKCHCHAGWAMVVLTNWLFNLPSGSKVRKVLYNDQSSSNIK
jgi:hypothetical protein